LTFGEYYKPAGDHLQFARRLVEAHRLGQLGQLVERRFLERRLAECR
jgi:hypothetical protein